MTFRNARIATSLAILLHATGAVAAAQTTVAPGPPPCTYMTCALRVEPVFLGMALVRGAAADSAVRLSGFGHGVEMLLTGPDSAAAYGRRYITANKRSSTLSLIAVTAIVLVAARTDNFRSAANGIDGTLGIVGASAAIVSMPFTIQSQRDLAKAVWWYNAALPH